MNVSKVKDSYDWIVLGDHPGALLSASLMANLGHSVLVLPLFQSALFEMTREGQAVDPESNLLLGLGQSGGVQGLLAELMSQMGVLAPGLKVLRMGEESLPQIVSPESRICLRTEDRYLYHEFERELGVALTRGSGLMGALERAQGGAMRYWNQLPERLMQSANSKHPLRRSKSRVLEGLRRALQETAKGGSSRSRDWLNPRKSFSDLKLEITNSELRNFVSGLFYGLYHSEWDEVLTPDVVHALSISKTSASFVGGMSAYRSFLIDLAKRQGAVFPESTECRRVFIEGGRVVGVQISQRGKMIGAKAAIIGCSLDHVRDFFYFSGVRKHHNLKKAPQPRGWRFTLALTIHKEAIPPGMNRRTIFKQDRAPAVEFELGNPEEYRLPDEDNALLFVRTWMPFTQESLEVDYQRTVSARLFKLAQQLIPFLEFHVVKLFPDFRRSGPGLNEEFSEVFGFVSPEIIPENLRMISGDGVGYKSGVDGLYVASGESYPKLGSFGGVVAAISAVSDQINQEKSQGKDRLSEIWKMSE